MAEVVFINCFQVPAGREEAFLGLWSQIDGLMQTQPGFQWRRLHRSLDPAARNRFVNVASWDSAAEFDAAHGEEFRRLVGQPEWREFPALPTLCSVERDTH